MRVWICLPLPLTLLFCGSCLSTPDVAGKASPSKNTSDGGAPTLTITAVPSAAPGEVTPICQFVIESPTAMALDSATVALAKGTIPNATLAQLRHHSATKTLRTRSVSISSWGAETGAKKRLFVSPSEPLLRGEKYTLAIGSASARWVFQVQEHDDEVPTLARVWPPKGQSATAERAVYCGSTSLPPMLEIVGNATSPITIHRGVMSAETVATCVTLEAQGMHPASLAPPPALASSGGRIVARLDPHPVAVETTLKTSSQAHSCEPPAILFGPACATVEDDRVVVYGPEMPLFSVVRVESAQALQNLDRSPLVVRDLVPSSSYKLEGLFLDLAGSSTQASLAITTAAPRAHVVINEVLATPFGSKRISAWVELYNDGTRPADLTGWSLAGAHGFSLLPAVTLEPHGFALVVDENFTPGTNDNAPPDPSALVIALPHLASSLFSGKAGPLTLRDAQSESISSFPALPKPKRGVSVCRRKPETVDQDPQGFVLAPQGTPTPGAPNNIPEDFSAGELGMPPNPEPLSP